MALIAALSLALAVAGCGVVSPPKASAPAGTEQLAGTEQPAETEQPAGADQAAGLDKLGEVYDILLDEHVDHTTLDSEQLTDGAMRGIIEALDDRHAAYLTAEQHQRSQEEYRGYFEGIGARVTLTDAGLTVIAPIHGAPAEAAGIRAGDVVLAVDGESIAGLTLIESVNLIRGPGGTDVTLLIRRADGIDTVSITVTRGQIPIASTDFTMLDDGIGHLWVYGFSDNTEGDVRAALNELEAAGGRGLILDLRNNPGGLLGSVVKIAGLFLDDVPILYEINAQGGRIDHVADAGGPAINIPLVVLVNEYSASASEILAGAIKVNGRGTVIGATTFGKGAVNITRELSDGSAIYFTVRRWYLPDGTQIEGHGVTPDVVVAATATVLPAPLAEDVALQKALEVLQQELAPAR